MSDAPGVRRGGRLRGVGVDAAVGAVVTALLLVGLARPGFPLLRDWVATPDPPLSDAALGLGESAARAVPQDVAVVWAGRALDAVGVPVWPLTGLTTALFCVWLAVAAGALARRVLPDDVARTAAGVWLRLPAVVLAVWNPFVVERLLQGHWSLLAGAAAVMSLPVLLARGRPRAAPACAALAAAGITPTGWLLAVVAAAVALACAGPAVRGRGRAALALTATAVITALPWLVATALAGTGGAAGGTAGGDTGVGAFAARAEPGIGTLGSVLAGGGIWNSEAVPPSRATWWAAVALLLLLAVWSVAAPGLWRARTRPVVRATVPLAVAVWSVVALAATGPGLAVMDALVGAVPGAGLLRDTQKFVALALPAMVLAATLAARALAVRTRPVGAAVLVGGVVVAAVPDAPAALWSQLRPVTYGPGWTEVDRLVAEAPGPAGDVLVLPAGSFRSTPLWADGAPVLDPAPRLLDARVLVPGDLLVGGAGSVSGEGDRARRATDALLAGENPRVLTDLGVRWVLDERTSAGPRGESGRTVATTTTRFSDPELVLHDLATAAAAGPVRSVPHAQATDRTLVLGAHAAWLVAGLLTGVFAGILAGRRSAVPALRDRPRRRPLRPGPPRRRPPR